MAETKQLIEALRNLPAEVSEVDYRKRGFHLEVTLTAGQVPKLAGLLRDRQFYLCFVSAVHVSPDIEMVYQFACFARPCRIVARAPVAADGTVPTISDIFHGANWHERETRDMFGVVFTDHPYPEPLLLPEEDADLRPLLKEEGKVKPAADFFAAPQRDDEGEIP